MDCAYSLFGEIYNYIKVGNGELLAVEGANLAERMRLSDLRIPYKQLLKSKIILKPGQVNYLLNHLGLGDNVTFLAIKALYNVKALEEDNYLIWKYYDSAHIEHHMSQLMILTGNSAKRIPQLFLSNPNANYSVTLEVMIAVIDDNTSFFNYKPVVYFTNIVNLENTEYTRPFNTSMGDTFGATLSFTQSFTYSKSDVIDALVYEVRDSNGYVMTTEDDNYLLFDEDDNEIDNITILGTYSLYFDITDSLGNSVDPVDKIQIRMI